MIYACTECGGSGKSSDWETTCIRCSEMPKVSVGPNSTVDMRYWRLFLAEQTMDRGWFKPDPDAMARWCFEHEASLPEGNTLFCWPYEAPEVGSACDIGWIARPDRLEVVE